MSQQATMSRWQRFRQSDLIYFLKDKVAIFCFLVCLLRGAGDISTGGWRRITRMIRLPMTLWMPKCRHHGWKAVMLTSCSVQITKVAIF